MLEAAFWGFVGGASLLIGALVGLFLSVPIRLVGLVMGFGVGVLMSRRSGTPWARTTPASVLDVDVGEDPVRPVAILLGIALSAERGRIVGMRRRR